VKPIKKDGHGFYYSDYNQDGSKFYHPYKWHCCTGTFSQITADYGISAYFHDDRGIYVNLYVPSKVTWAHGHDRVTLTQMTIYPHVPSTQIVVTAEKASSFPIYLRIPSWAGPKTRVTVNGKQESIAIEPGKFASIARTWKNNDRIEIEFDMRTTLEPVDPQHPALMAAVHGPLALFAVGDIPPSVSRSDLSSVAQTAHGSSDWRTATGAVTMRPFTAIQDERYRLYQKLETA